MPKKFRPATFETNPSVPPLTDAERKWVQEFNRMLQACPSRRLGAATAGDARLTIYDREQEKQHTDRDRFDASKGDFIPWLTQRGLVLADVYATFNIDSTAA